MTAATATATRKPSRLVRDVLGLFKLRIGLMIMLTALVGFAINISHLDDHIVHIKRDQITYPGTYFLWT